MLIPFDDAVRILSLALQESSDSFSDNIDSLIADHPSLRIDTWLSLLEHYSSNTVPKYARKITAVLGSTFCHASFLLSNPTISVAVVQHLRDWLWTIAAFLSSATGGLSGLSSTRDSSGTPMLTGMGASMFGRVEEVLLIVAPALRLYALATPATIATLRGGLDQSGCPLVGIAVLCCELLARTSASPSNHKKLFEACFGGGLARGMGSSSAGKSQSAHLLRAELLGALCSTRAAVVADLNSIPLPDGVLVSQAAKLLLLIDDALGQLPFECGSISDVPGAFCASAMLVDASTASRLQLNTSAAAVPSSNDAGSLLIIDEAMASPAPLLGEILLQRPGQPEWRPPHTQTRERAVFETLFDLANGPQKCEGTSTAVLGVLPHLLEQFIRRRRENVLSVGKAAPPLRSATVAVAPIAVTPTCTPAATLSVANPEFMFLCEMIAVALFASVNRGVSQGPVPAGSGIRVLPGGITGAAFRLRALTSLLAVALKHGLYNVHEDVAPHPQLAVLEAVSCAALVVLRCASSNVSCAEVRAADTKAVLGIFEVLLQLDHRIVQPHVSRLLCGAVDRWPREAASEAAPVYATAARFSAALCGVFSRLRALPALLESYWVTALRQLVSADSAANSSLPFRAVFLSRAHISAFEAAMAGLPSGQMQEIGTLLNRQLEEATKLCQAAAISAGFPLVNVAAVSSSKKRRREASVSEVGGGAAAPCLESAVALFSAVACYAATFVQHMRVTPASALPLLNIVQAFSESGSAPLLLLCKKSQLSDHKGQNPLPLSDVYSAAAAAAVQLAVACSTVALECAPHLTVRALVASVIDVAASDANAHLPGVLDISWPLSCFRDSLAMPARAHFLVEEALNWWPADSADGGEVNGQQAVLATCLSQLASSRLRSLHAVKAHLLRSTECVSGVSEAVKVQTDDLFRNATMMSDLLLSRSSPAVASAALDVASTYATVSVLAVFVRNMCNFPDAATPGSWQYSLWRDAELYELSRVLVLLPGALTEAVRAALASICSAGSSTAPALQSSSEKTPKKVSAGTTEIFSVAREFLNCETRELQLRAVLSLAKLPPLPSADFKFSAALTQAHAVLSFIACAPSVVTADDALSVNVAALRAVFIALGCEHAPHQKSTVNSVSADLLPVLVRQARAKSYKPPTYDERLALCDSMGEALAGKLADDLSAALRVTSGAATGDKGKRKSLKVVQAAETLAGVVSPALADSFKSLLAACGLSSSNEDFDDWTWPELAACTKSIGARTSLSLLERQAASIALASLAANLSRAPGLSGALHLLVLAVNIVNLDASDSPPAPVARLCASAAECLSVAAAEADASSATRILRCLAGLLLPSSVGCGVFIRSLVTLEVVDLLLLATCDGADVLPALRNGPTAVESASLLMIAPLADLSTLLVRAVKILQKVRGDDFADANALVLQQRSAVAFLSACVSAAAQGYYRRGGGTEVATFGAPIAPSGDNFECLGSGTRDARDLVSAAVDSALVSLVQLTVDAGTSISKATTATIVGLHVEVLATLRLFLSHPRVVFLSLAHVKLCLEALYPLVGAAGWASGFAGFSVIAVAGSASMMRSTDTLHAAGFDLEDTDAFARLDLAAPLLVNAAAVAAAAVSVVAKLGQAETISVLSHDDDSRCEDTIPLVAFPLAASNAALTGACGVLQATLKYHRGAALALMPLVSQLLQAAIVLATSKTASEVGSTFNDGFPESFSLTALLRVCEETARAIKVARFHVVPILARLLVQWARVSGGSSLPSRVRERLLPALHALFDVCTPRELQMLHTALSLPPLAVARAQFKELHAAFAAHAKYKGKL